MGPSPVSILPTGEGVFSRVFRGKFIAGLRRAYRRKKLRCHGPIAELEDPKRFASFLRTIFRQDWVVYAKPAFGGPTQVLRYLGRYTPASLSATTDCWPSMVSGLPSAGKTTRMAANNAK